MSCCVWWNFKEEIINHFELVQNGAVNAAALYIGQLDDRVCAALAARCHPVSTNRKLRRRTMLLLSSKRKSRSCLKLNFFLIQLIALTLHRHLTITCSAPWLTSFAGARLSIFWRSSKMGVGSFLHSNRLSGIVVV